MRKRRFRMCNIELTERQSRILDKYLGGYGMKKKVFSALVEDLVKMLEKDAASLISGIYQKEISLKDIMRNGGNQCRDKQSHKG